MVANTSALKKARLNIRFSALQPFIWMYGKLISAIKARNKLLPALLICFLPVTMQPVVAENASNSQLKIRGVVLDENLSPLGGVRVHLHETGETVHTDSLGEFEVAGLQPGSYHVHVYLMGYRSTAETVRLRSSNAQITFQMRPTILEMGEVLIEAQPYKLEDREKSLQVEVMEKEALKRHQRTSFAETIERVPGVRTISTGKGIAKPMLRGLSFHRIAIVDRGIKQEGQQWGADHGLEIDPYDVERVEIIKGPNSIVYGSDASGGVISIRTPSFPAEGHIRGSADFRAESNHELLGGSAMIEGNHRNTFYRFRYSRQEFGNLTLPADSFTYAGFRLPIDQNRLKNTGGKDQTFTGTVGMQREWGHSQLTVSHFDQMAGLFPGAFSHPGSYSTRHENGHRTIGLPRQVTSHSKVISNTKLLFRDNWIEADLGYQLNQRLEEGEPHQHGNRPMPEGTDHLDLQLHTLTANLRYHHTHNDRRRGIFGVSANAHKNRAGGFEFLIPEHEGADVGAFAYQHIYLSENLIANGGIRYDYGTLLSHRYTEPDYDAEGNEDGEIERAPEIQRSFSNISGTTGLTYHPSEEVTLKTNIARHFRLPRSPELASNGFHHGTFRHERGNSELNAEVGYQWDFSATYRKSNFLVTATPFANYYQNFIYLNPTFRFSRLPGGGQVYEYQQNRVLMWGGELVTEFHPIDPLHLEAGLDYVWAQNLDERLPLPFTPPASIFAEAEYEFGVTAVTWLQKNFINLNIRAYANQERVARNERVTEGSVLWNTAAGTTVNFSENTSVSINFQVRNLLDTYFQNHLSTYRKLNLPEPGRTYAISVSIPFHVMQN